MGKKQIASRTAGDATSGKSRVVGWERSKFTKGDLRKVRQFGLLPAATEVKFPGDETMPRLDEGWRVMFLAFLFRGLSIPAHEFLRELLFVYGVQLHQLTPNSILHIACFITLCECFLDIHPHWGLWRSIFFIRRNATKTAIHNVGGAIISIRPEAEYFDFKMAESVQNWRKKWFYIKDEKAKEQKFDLAPFDQTKSVKKLKSWDQPLTGAELKETELLMARIHTLQTDEGKELSGLQIMTHFLRLWIQPIQARVHSMWNYMGSKDPTKISKEDLSTAELEKIARQFTTLTAADAIPSSCRVTPFDKKHLPPARDWKELRKAPQAPPKKKLKEHDATKGIKIFENPQMPSMDDPIAREMMDMAIRHIRFRDEAKSLEVALKRSQHRADELGAKLEAAGKALEEASARATAAEEKLAGEKSKTATREADIRLRLDTLNASFIKNIGDSYEMPED
ncbi:hypothetical protein ACQ4PT_028807 [Festuca glaucescens]